MIADAFFVTCSFGSAMFDFFMDLVAAKSGRSGAATFSQPHACVEPFKSNKDRLRFLDEATQVIRGGRLSQAYQPQNDSPANQATKPGASFEK